ncbi:MAG: glycosyltransferase family 2 protein [Acidimicrobiales bacterium]
MSGVTEEAISSEELVDALARTAGAVASLLPSPGEAERYSLPWGPDAATDHAAYRYWVRDDASRRAALAETLPRTGPTISVVVPVYKPELWYFRACIESVQAQRYEDWELCLCDDASGDAALGDVLHQLDADRRCRVTVLEENGGISRATNAALDRATGEFVALLDHDDTLTPDALAHVAAAVERWPDADVLYSDDDKIDAAGVPYQPHFKPDWAPDLLLSYPYMGHLLVVRRSLLEEIGGFRSEVDGSQDYDVMLRATERARRVVHIPHVLYHWRAVTGSAAGDAEAKPWAHRSSRRALEDAVRRRGIDGDVEDGPFPGAYHLRRRVPGTPSVSVIVPFRDQAAMTMACLRSLEQEEDHERLDVVLVDNGSVEPETRAVLERIEGPVRVLEHDGPFNWSVINNLAAASCTSDYLLFMNNDIEARRPGWLGAMVELAQRPDVGAVGARLVYDDGVVQHAGVVLGQHGIAGHVFMGLPAGGIGYFGWDRLVRPYSAVTGACLMTRRSLFEEMGGFDEELEVAFNDIDFCLRVVDRGLHVLYTPHAELVHHESISRGMSGFFHDYRYFLAKWDRSRIHDDPCYNPNLSLFAQWCPLRGAGEEDRWRALMDELQGLT